MAEVLPTIHIQNPHSPSRTPDDTSWPDHSAPILHRHSPSIESTARDSSLAPRSRDASSQPFDPISQELWIRNGGILHTKAAYHPDILQRPPSNAGANDDGSRSIGSAVKEKKKGVSFLARLINNKKKENDDKGDVVTSPDEIRPEGADAQIFQEPFDYMGYSPEHPPPPTYIKVRSKNKVTKDFNRVFLAQELQQPSAKAPPVSLPTARGRATSPAPTPGNALYTSGFSKDGRYLATAGQDSKIRIWAVIGSTEERRSHELQEEDEANTHSENVRMSAPVFRRQPLRTLEGHGGPILDLSWSKNNFLLSCSMDKTVRLWHISQSECLCAFRHNDVVTSIQFHPKDDRFFLAGSLDTRLRLWSIPDKTVAYHVSVSDIITAVAFTPDGRTVIAGSVSGICTLFDTDQLKLQTTIHVKSTRGKNSRGSKITGIETITTPAGSSTDTKILITSNDSRIRLYNLRDKCLEAKFKGLQNSCSQIKARFSDDARFVICGSEDNKVFIWNTIPAESDGRNKFPVEVFEASSAISSIALFAPVRTRMLLNASADPIYEICNPPPVQLLSKAEEESLYSKAQTDADSLAPSEFRIPREARTPGYLLRSQHPNGPILIVGDAEGGLRVFRQDCAASKRFTESPLKRTGTGFIRRASLATQRSGRSRRSSLKSQAPSERILNWRQSITSNAPNAPSVRSLSIRQPASNVASPAPEGPSDTPSTRKASLETASSISTSAQLRPPMRANTTSSAYFRKEAWKEGLLDQLTTANAQFDQRKTFGSSSRATSSASLQNLAMLETRVSRVSNMSSAASSASGLHSASGERDTDEEGRERRTQSSAGMMKCRRCGGLDFKARIRPGVGLGNRGQVSCMRCGLLGG